MFKFIFGYYVAVGKLYIVCIFTLKQNISPLYIFFPFPFILHLLHIRCGFFLWGQKYLFKWPTYINLRTYSVRNPQPLGQIDVGIICIQFDRPTRLPAAGRYVTIWSIMCTVRLESETSGTWIPGRHKQNMFMPYCTDFPCFSVR